MSVTIKGKLPEQNETLTLVDSKKKKRTHVEAEPYSGSSDFTVANWMYHLDLSHSAVHARMMPSRKRRRIPPPDGATPWTWQPATAYEYLKKCQPKHLRESRGIVPPA